MMPNSSKDKSNAPLLGQKGTVLHRLVSIVPYTHRLQWSPRPWIRYHAALVLGMGRETLVEFVLYLLLGACAGVLAGLFGVGGGMIIVPVLVFSFTLQGFDPQVLTHLAVGTSLASIIFTSVNAVREHQRKGAVRWPIFAWMTVGILIGAGFGALTAEAISRFRARTCKKSSVYSP